MGGRNENKRIRTLVCSKRKKEEVCDTFIAFCASVNYRERVFERISPKATRNVDSSSQVAQPGSVSTGPSSRLPPTSVDYSLLLTALFCRLPCSVLFSRLFSSFCAFPRLLPVSWEISRASPFVPKQTRGSSDWHPHPQKRMHPSCHTLIFLLNINHWFAHS